MLQLQHLLLLVGYGWLMAWHIVKFRQRSELEYYCKS